MISDAFSCRYRAEIKHNWMVFGLSADDKQKFMYNWVINDPIIDAINYTTIDALNDPTNDPAINETNDRSIEATNYLSIDSTNDPAIDAKCISSTQPYSTKCYIKDSSKIHFLKKNLKLISVACYNLLFIWPSFQPQIQQKFN